MIYSNLRLLTLINSRTNKRIKALLNQSSTTAYNQSTVKMKGVKFLIKRFLNRIGFILDNEGQSISGDISHVHFNSICNEQNTLTKVKSLSFEYSSDPYIQEIISNAIVDKLNSITDWRDPDLQFYNCINCNNMALKLHLNQEPVITDRQSILKIIDKQIVFCPHCHITTGIVYQEILISETPEYRIKNLETLLINADRAFEFIYMSCLMGPTRKCVITQDLHNYQSILKIINTLRGPSSTSYVLVTQYEKGCPVRSYKIDTEEELCKSLEWIDLHP